METNHRVNLLYPEKENVFETKIPKIPKREREEEKESEKMGKLFKTHMIKNR